MAEKDDRGNLGDELGQRQRQSLLELSSALQGRVPSLGIAFVRMIQSSDTVSDTVTYFLLFCLPYQRHLRWRAYSQGASKIFYLDHVPT